MQSLDRALEKQVAVAGCKHTTLEFIDGLLRQGYRPDHCITISPEQGRAAEVAGYMDLRDSLKEREIPVHLASKYSLKSSKDEEELSKLALDMLFVIGWQRLIPPWFLETLSVGAFGMHGSSKRLPYGRGRSPLNWSLIQNKAAFFTHLFRYAPGVDDGEVAGVQVFDITPHDSCLTLHYKNTVAMIQLVLRLLPELLAGQVTLTPQPADGASYYPKRSPDDSLIHWEDATLDIYNLVRAVTRPFAGAFTYLDDREDRRLTVWEAVPFDEHLFSATGVPGEILHVFHGGEFVVKTGTSSLLVKEAQGVAVHPGHIGQRLTALGRERKIWQDVPL